jgi:regulatory protein
MKITDIKQQVKRPERYSVYVDGKYSFSLPDIELSSKDLRIGTELDAVRLNQLKQDAELSKIYNQTLGQISRRMRSVWEIGFYLSRKQIAAEQIELVISRLVKVGFLDDKKFAEAWVRDRRNLKSVSKRRLELELKTKRVPEEIILEVLAEDEVSDQDSIRNMITKKRRQSRYQDTTKLMQYLARQGYNYDDIKKALQDNQAN